MTKDIAIIGMAGRFPESKNIEDFYEKLKNGADCVGPLSEKRMKETTIHPREDFKNAGYLDEVDKFDYKLFNLSYTEAVNMSPVHRLPLEVVYETLENAGYSPDALRGSNVSVYTSDSINNEYSMHADEFNPMLVTGNSSEFLATKISRHFNFTGNSVLLNTACSTSMVGLHLACNELVLDDAEYALVCGINLSLHPVKSEQYDMGLASDDGKSRAFSSQKSGMSFGETVCAILLKPLNKAIEDKDNIHAVIKGWASNNNGISSSSIMAPHSKMQAEVMHKAWKKSGIKPEDLGFIEAHGSGTELGDSLEIEGLTLAFKELTEKKQFIPISTVKSNIGHCMLAAGLAGIIKTTLSLKHKQLFPSIHCEELNPLIDFKNSPVYVNTTFKPWESENTRLAGVTSLGRGGVNSHVVLSEYAPPVEENIKEESDTPLLFSFSGKTHEIRRKNVHNFLQHLTLNPDLPLKDISFTLNAGRNHYPYRTAVIANNKLELLEKLKQEAEHQDNCRKAQSDWKLFTLFTGDSSGSALIKQLATQHQGFDKALMSLRPYLTEEDSALNAFIFQYCFFSLLETYGLSSTNFLSTGIGKIAKDFILEKLTLEEAVSKCQSYQPASQEDVTPKIRRLIEQQNSKMLIIAIGGNSDVCRAFEGLQSDEVRLINTCQHEYEVQRLLADVLKEMYLHHADISWSKIFNKQDGYKVELPTYAFEKSRCWLREEPRPQKGLQAQASTETAQQKNVHIKEQANDLQRWLAEVFAQTLEIDSISLNDDFFELGGDSLKATKVISKLNEEEMMNLDFEDLFDFPTVNALAEYLLQSQGMEQVISRFWKEVLKVEKVLPVDDFFELGGNSLLANQLITRIRQALDVSLDFEEIFENGQLNEMTELVEQKMQNKKQKNSAGQQAPFRPAIAKAEKREYYPVSSAQQRFVYLDKMYDTGTAYNSSVIFKVSGPLESKQVERAFQKLIDRYECFRMAFRFIDGKAVQMPDQSAELDFKLEDLSTKALEMGIDALVQETVQAFVKPFDISQPPLLRVGLARLKEDKWLLLCDMSHLVSDRATSDILTRDFILLYNKQTLSEVKWQYKDYAVWEQNTKRQKFKESEAFWLKIFEQEVNELPLPYDYPRPASLDHKGGIHDFAVSGGVYKKLRQLAQQEKSTLYILLLTSLNVFFHRLTGHTDITIGAPYAQRDKEELENMVGVLLNTIVFRNQPASEKSFKEFLSEVRQKAMQVYSHNQYPFERLLDKLKYQRRPDRTPLFNVMLNSQTSTGNNGAHQATQQQAMEINGVTFERYQKKSITSNFDLSFQVEEHEKFMHFKVTYRSSLFNHSTIIYLMDEYEKLLGQIAECSELKLKDFKVFSHKAEKAPAQKKIINKIKP